MRYPILLGLCAALALACNPSTAPIDTPPDVVVVQPPQQETWARLRPLYWTAQDGSRFIAPWWFWANPATAWLPEYAQQVNGLLRDRGVAVPYTWRPLYDTKLAAPCLFYGTADGNVRCLPGWPQIAPDDPLDGFYSDPKCEDWTRWLFVLPTSEATGPLAQRFLVTAKMMIGSTPSVHVAVPHTGRVWQRHMAGPVRICEEYRGDALKCFTKGDERALVEFVPLGAMAIDAGPG